MPIPSATPETAAQLATHFGTLFRRPDLLEKGYKVFESQVPYDLTLIGVRNPSDNADAFDDTLICLFRDERLVWQCRAWAITTDPGKEALAEPMRQAGTAIVAPGAYRGCWTKGKHHPDRPTGYTAFVQAKPSAFWGWRDPNKDARLDRTGKLYDDLAGINMHKSGTPASTRVGGWSAGCQVFSVAAGLTEMLALYDLQVKHHPTSKTISYFLLDAGDVPELAVYLP